MPALNPSTGQVVIVSGVNQSPDATLTLVLTAGAGVELTANRALTLTTGDGDRDVTLSGDLTVEADSIVNQDLSTDATVTFAVVLADLTGSTAPTSVITSGTFADALIAESNVTQHEAALTVTESQISDLGTSAAMVADNLSVFASTTSAQLRGVLSDETGTGVAVFATSPTLVTPILGTPTSGTLTNCTGPTSIITSGTFADARIAESNVTQHEAALTVTKSQISDLPEVWTLQLTTTDATATTATSDGAAVSSSNIPVLTDDQTLVFEASVVAMRTDTGTDTAQYGLKGRLRRGTGAASTAISGIAGIYAASEDDATWGVWAAANTTEGGVAIQCTGAAGATIHWKVTLRITRVS